MAATLKQPLLLLELAGPLPVRRGLRPGRIEMQCAGHGDVPGHAAAFVYLSTDGCWRCCQCERDYVDSMTPQSALLLRGAA